MENMTYRILVVDDDRDIRELLCELLVLEGYDCVATSSGEMAIEMLKNESFHLVLSDIAMPGMSGMELLAQIKEVLPDVAVIMATGVSDRKTAIGALEQGAYGYLIKPFDVNDILINVANALERRRLFLLSQDYERELERRVEERTQEVRSREEEIVHRLISSMGCRDCETGAHARRLGLYAAAISEARGWSRENVEDIRLASPMHDLGKIGIPDQILLKPGKLTTDEFEIMKKHSEIGAAILEDSEISMLQMARDIAMYHHERWNGSGYPFAIGEAEIPEPARIVAIVDVYDALLHDRVYRPRFPEEEAVSIMVDMNKAGHFDPEIFDLVLDLLPDMREIREDVQDETHVHWNWNWVPNGEKTIGKELAT